MLGKVWSSGALQVVQQISIIPQSVHPRNKLKGALHAHVASVPWYLHTQQCKCLPMRMHIQQCKPSRRAVPRLVWSPRSRVSMGSC